MSKLTYLDYAAATPLDNSVLFAMKPYWQDKFYNPSALSLPARAIKQDLESARAKVAQILGSRPSEIIFTAGGTEANNLALFGVMASFPEHHIVTTALEHESVLLPVRKLSQKGYQLTEVKPDEKGLINVSKILAAIKDNTVLVSVMYANNEVGTVQPIKQIATAIEEVRKERKAAGNKTPLYLHTDAAQAANYLDLHVHRLGVDLMTINGGKIYGPKQSGCLFVRVGIDLEPLLYGGGQEQGKRSGTENVAAFIGFSKALEVTADKRHSESERLQKLQQECIQKLTKTIPNLVINGSEKRRLPNNVHFTIPGADNERLLYGLEDKGVICAAGSACSASKEEASHVLLSMGITEDDARASLRVSFGRQTNSGDIDKLVDSLKAIV